MEARLKVITRLPLVELWREDGLVNAERLKDLYAGDIIALLRHGKVRFVVADVGLAPRWIPLEDCHSFWKLEVKTHLAEPQSAIYLSTFPGEYCYRASEWRADEAGMPIVVLEKHH